MKKLTAYFGASELVGLGIGASALYAAPRVLSSLTRSLTEAAVDLLDQSLPIFFMPMF